jgi:hypothetical protein
MSVQMTFQQKATDATKLYIVSITGATFIMYVPIGSAPGTAPTKYTLGNYMAPDDVQACFKLYDCTIAMPSGWTPP